MDDPRIGDIIQNVNGTIDERMAPGSVVIVGFPFDEGVRRNGGKRR
jgi:hypothetical protein